MTSTAQSPKPERHSICFPVFERLQVLGYDLYPGPERDDKGLQADLPPGLTVILGANGLGKTTLVWILYRLLSGPYDIAGLDKGGDLGRRTLRPRKLRQPRIRMFASRVMDGADEAVARLTFRLGRHTILVGRRLSDLGLTELTIDGEELLLDEKSFQTTLADIAGLWSFGDWIILLRHLTFYFEDRRELVWDSSAQQQILRFLFLPAATAQQWTEDERQILKLDSRTRNLSAALTREEKELTEAEQLEEGSVDLREELKGLGDLQEADTQRREELDESLLDSDAERKSARLAMLQAEQEREATFRALEHAKLVALEERFPTASETARYIFAQLLTEADCLACGSHVPEVALDLESRMSESRCIICGSELSNVVDRSTEPASLTDKRLNRALNSLDKADAALALARTKADEAESRYRGIQEELQALESAIARRRERIDTLIRRLPKEEAALHEQREELARLRSRVVTLKDELTIRRKHFSQFIDGVTASIVKKAPLVKSIFEAYAKEFLIEDCSLVWSQSKERVGQTGILIEFPAFELELASAAFPSKVRRTGPEQVSESQREFIDLSFRMALMAAADEDGAGTLVIDAPESSLDAVFVQRAADVLARFARSDRGNRLIVTSNLTEGELIPRLLARFQDDWEHRLIDLFEIAEPTAAVRELRSEYREVRDRVFSDLMRAGE